MLFRRTLIAAFAAFAALATIGAPARADNAAEAQAFIQQLADTAMSNVAVKDIPDQERESRFRSLFVNAFDLPEIGKLVLGRYWRQATPEQQAEFLKSFEDIQVYTWTKRFKDYAGETLEILSVNPEGETDFLVESRIKRQKLDPIAVGWRVRKTGAAYKVLDIKVEGASMAFTHRSEYTSVIQSSGGKIDGLLVAMQKKVSQMQAQAGN